MTYRRRQTPDANLADGRSQTERLAAVRSVWFVRQSNLHRFKTPDPTLDDTDGHSQENPGNPRSGIFPLVSYETCERRQSAETNEIRRKKRKKTKKTVAAISFVFFRSFRPFPSFL